MLYGLCCMVYGVWFMVNGLWFMVYGLWFMVYGLWFMVQNSGCIVEDYRPCFRVHASSFRVQGPEFRVQGSRSGVTTFFGKAPVTVTAGTGSTWIKNVPAVATPRDALYTCLSFRVNTITSLSHLCGKFAIARGLRPARNTGSESFRLLRHHARCCEPDHQMLLLV